MIFFELAKKLFVLIQIFLTAVPNLMKIPDGDQ